jgi:hypothetical protein
MSSLILLLSLSGVLLGLLPPLASWPVALPITIFHVLLAVAFVALAGSLLYPHMRKNGHWRAGGRSGWAALVSLSLVVISGSSLLIQGQRGRLPILHTIAGLGLLAIVFAHGGFAHLRRRFRSSFRLVLTGGFAVLAAGLMLSARPTHSTVSPEVKEFPPASMRILGELPPFDEEILGASRCADCHAQIVAQWKESMHAVADTELLYARVVGEFRKDYGFEASNWCAGCHSPLRLGRGELNEKVASVAQPNVDCIVCHTIRKAQEPIGNNHYDMAFTIPSRYGLAKAERLSDKLLLLQPAMHRSMWNGSFMRSAEFCGVCHRQTLPDSLTDGHGGLVIQDTYQEWAKSRYNTADQATRRTCQDCHMPVASGLAGDLGNQRPSHLFLGGSMDIARILGAHSAYAESKRFLEKAATVAVNYSGSRQGGIGLSVIVTNSGAGHNLPTGVTDLRDLWLAVTVTDEANEVVYESGKLDSSGFLDPSAVRFGMTLGDGKGAPVYFHHITCAREILSDTSIAAGETREVNYIVSGATAKRLTAEVKLLYRAVPQAFINHYMTPDLRTEVVVMSTASATVELTP